MSSAYSKVFSYIYRGVVEDNRDPEGLGRCKVRVPFIHGELTYSPSLLPWARQVSSMYINNKRGNYNIPEIGDIVWVMFEGADRNFPVYLGGTYGSGDISSDPDKVILYTDNGNSITYEDESFRITVGDNTVVLSKSGVSICGSKVTVNGDLLIDSDNTILNGNLVIGNNVTIKGNLTVEGSVTSLHKST